ncbi:hypothetical protein MASR2M78_10680 [Treponema sp.]
MKLHGAGCCLIDYLYANVDFGSPSFNAARSRTEGDGGLTPGRLVFAEDFERFIGKPYETALQELSGGVAATKHNLGGPSVVALAHTAQLRTEDSVRFYGVRGDDETGRYVEEFLARLPFDHVHINVEKGPTPRTDVLSDPNYDNGHGERTFINLIGTAGHFGPANLEDEFYDADIVALGGTGIMPLLHDGMTEVLQKARSRGAATVVNLVYDFRSELNAPNEKWKLGLKDDAYPHIDVLVADREEALKTSGQKDAETAIAWFLSQGVGAAVVTEGSRNIRLASQGGIFAPLSERSMPVCIAVNEELAAYPERRGDTTGCGDNFAGGLLASMLEQLATAPRGKLDLTEAAVWAVASGGFACFTIGGTYYEETVGEKRAKLLPYVGYYRDELRALAKREAK